MLHLTILILMYCGAVILLYKVYLHHTKPDIKSYWWYKGPAMYDWENEEISQFSEKDYHIWRCVSKDRINQRRSASGGIY